MSQEKHFKTTDAIDLLLRTPRLLDVWLRDLPEDWLHANEGGESFSAFEVVGHLISGERSDWIGRAQHILDGSSEPFRPFDRFSHRTEFAGRPMGELLDTFATLRAANVGTLEAFELSEEQLELPGLHPALGPVKLRQLLATWVVHDEGHIAQIARVLAKRYSTAVGPWREYLTVLGDRVRDDGAPS